MIDIESLKAEYINESSGLLQKLEQGLLVLEKTNAPEAQSETILRSLHTIKGTSGMYGFGKVAELSHDLETIFGELFDRKIDDYAQMVQLGLDVVDFIRQNFSSGSESAALEGAFRQIVERIISISTTFQIEIEKYQTQAEDEGQSDDQNSETLRKWHLRFKPDETLEKRNIHVVSALEDILRIGKCTVSLDESGEIPVWDFEFFSEKTKDDIEFDIYFIADYCELTQIDEKFWHQPEHDSHAVQELAKPHFFLETPTAAPHISAAVLQPAVVTVGEQLVVASHKLDTLFNLVSSLITSKSELMLAIEARQPEKIVNAAQEIDKLSKSFRDTVLSVRLMPLSELTSRFTRLVRDLAKELEKKIDFVVSGDDVELDKNIVDAMSEPIMHLIRNCIDHGIGSPERRLEMGKSETGIIKFFAYQAGSFVFIQIADDGKGIQKDRVLQKAKDLGLIKPNAQLSDKEIYNLIFSPGFSTADSLTHISGRGMGMDIVRSKLEELRGEISVESEEGLGTSFTIKLQQTISIIDTLLVRAHNSTFAIPLEDVEQCQFFTQDTDFNYRTRLYNFADELIPFNDMRSLMGLPTTGISKRKVLVIRKHGALFGIVVDEIMGEYQAVVKSLGSAFAGLDCLAGACILGNGGIAILVDTERLKRLVIGNF